MKPGLYYSAEQKDYLHIVCESGVYRGYYIAPCNLQRRLADCTTRADYYWLVDARQPALEVEISYVRLSALAELLLGAN